MSTYQCFNPWAQKSEDYLISYLRSNNEAYLRVRLFAEKHLGDVWSVADIGCGTGGMLDHLVDSGVGTQIRYIGVDKTEKAISICRSRYTGLPQAMFVCADLRALPGLAADLVIVKDVLEHLPCMQESIPRVLGISKKVAILSFFNVWQKPSQLQELDSDYYFSCFNADEVAQLCISAGFRVSRRVEYTWLAEEARAGLQRINPDLVQYQKGYPALYELVRTTDQKATIG